MPIWSVIVGMHEFVHNSDLLHSSLGVCIPKSYIKETFIENK
jgi:hypothetical protein